MSVGALHLSTYPPLNYGHPCHPLAATNPKSRHALVPCSTHCARSQAPGKSSVGLLWHTVPEAVSLLPQLGLPQFLIRGFAGVPSRLAASAETPPEWQTPGVVPGAQTRPPSMPGARTRPPSVPGARNGNPPEADFLEIKVICLRETQRKIAGNDFFWEFMSFSLGEHRGKSAGCGLF